MKGKGICLLLLLGLLLTGGMMRAYAYLSDREQTVNKITPGDSKIEILEEFDPPKSLNPGDVFTKKVEIRNLGKSSCFIRCRLIFDREDLLSHLILDLDTANWCLEPDGYYYYVHAVKAGACTSKLLQKITVKEDIPEELLKEEFSIYVYAESYQQGEFQEKEWKKAWEYFERNKKEETVLAAKNENRRIYGADEKTKKKTLQKAEGKVDIELKEYTVDEKGKEIPWKNPEHTLPGQEIIKIPRITNLESTCEIRAKIEMTMEKDVEIPVTEKLLKGMPKEWEKEADGYYYYRKKLQKGESVDLFTGFTIPETWDTRYDTEGAIEKYYTENRIDVVVTVEAIGTEDWEGEKTVVHSPKTGDRNRFWLFAGLAGLSEGLFLLILAVDPRGRRK